MQAERQQVYQTSSHGNTNMDGVHEPELVSGDDFNTMRSHVRGQSEVD